jgi:hypothetical protein
MSQDTKPIDYAKQVGESYLNDSFESEDSKRIETAYKQLTRINKHLFDRIPVNVVFTEKDPYDNFEEMKQDIEENDRMKIFAGGSTPKHLTERENNISRAVHDYFGHYRNNVPFTLEGEFRKWYNMRDMYPKNVSRLLFSEVVCQTSAVIHLGGFTDEFRQRGIFPRKEWIETFKEMYNVE